jgi:sulfur-oxidizing protein SoxY
MKRMTRINRRLFMKLGFLFSGANVLPVLAKPDEAKAEIQSITQGRPLQKGKVQIELPQLVDNGNLVVVSVSVDSPMTKENHVKEMHLIAEGNPLPRIFSSYMDERAGKASFTIRVRLADSQLVWAIAKMNDGSFWYQTAETVVTSSACTENLV